MSSFTPGPWRIGLPHVVWQTVELEEGGRRHTPIAECFLHDKEANARLIAAAPDLLAALKHALGVIVEVGDLNGFRNLTNEELGAVVIAVAKEASAVIAKAEIDPLPTVRKGG